MDGVRVIKHPLVGDKLRALRDAQTPRAEFRAALDSLSTLLLYEASRELTWDTTSVWTPMGVGAQAIDVDPTPLIVPVLRAGLGMMGAALRMFANADVAFVGLKRNETTFEPDPYLTSLPNRIERRQAVFVLDPMCATGNSLAHVCELLVDRGASRIILVCVLASPEGIERLSSTGMNIGLVTAAVDDKLNDQAYIVPGLGDAGDRLYGLY